MKRPAFTVLAFLCLAASSATLAGAQSSQPAQPSQTSAPPSTQQTSSTQPATGATSPAQTTDKKVWTNDDVGDLRDRSAISTIGNADPKPVKPGDKSARPPKGKDPKWYVDQIHALQAKIPPLDDKIQNLQDALSGKPVDVTRKTGWSNPDDWRDQLQRLQKERDDIQAKISALEDQARHDGVPPSLLHQ